LLIPARPCIRSIKNTTKEPARASTSGTGVGKRTGKDLILATRPYAVDHTLTSWWHILSTVALLLLALMAAFFNSHSAAGIAFSIFAGLFLLRLFVIYHDQQHHAILPKSRVMEIFMRLFGIYALSPSSIWRSSHNHHHKHNSKIKGAHIGSFPIMTKAQYAKSSGPARLAYLAARHPLSILFGYLTVFLYGMCLKPFLSKPREHFDCLIALVLHLGFGISLIHFFGWQAWLLVQVIPHFITYAIGTYLFYAQHNFPGVAFYDRAGWTYEKAALDSSSYMKLGPVMAWFTANIGYHHVHHLNARIPFYRLPQVQREMPELRHPKTTSLNPFEIRRCLRLKVWDVEAQRMVGL
jgi:acyl-lipid omega-6 desaturase (Delta-12 desaturase)